MRLPPAFLDDIRARLTLSSVIGRSVVWDRKKSQPGRGNFWACCPFHHEKSASFHVQDDKGYYHCFGCQARGDVFNFLVEKNGLSFLEAVKELAAEAGLKMPEPEEGAEKAQIKQRDLYEIMALAAVFFQEQLHAPHAAAARHYLQNRALSSDIQKEFGLGFAPNGRRGLIDYLAAKNIAMAPMQEAGLVVLDQKTGEHDAYDRFRDRIMFPIADRAGRIIAFGGRALSQSVSAKYLNSPETPLFHKGRSLYNLHRARKSAHQLSQLIVVEGYMDVIALHRCGLPHTVAPLGTAMSEEQLRLLWQMAPEPVLCFDGDSAGLRAARSALALALPLLKPGFSLRFAFLPDGKDPDDLLRSEGAAHVVQVIEQAQPLSDVIWQQALAENDRTTPERRARFEMDLRKQISSIADQAVRKHYDAVFGTHLRNLWGETKALPKIGSSFSKGSKIGKGFWGKGRSAKNWSDRPWDIQSGVSSQLKALVRTDMAQKALFRREGLILLTLINHLDILHDCADEIANLTLSTDSLDSLRCEILNWASVEPGLDQTRLRTHLYESGFRAALSQIEEQARLLSEWFLKTDVASQDARTGLRQMLALHRRAVTLDRELKAAEAVFASDPTAQNLLALELVRAELNSEVGLEATIKGFGAASGRKIGDLD